MSATTLPDSQLLLLGQTIEEEMAEYFGEIVNDLEALEDLDTFTVDTI